MCEDPTINRTELIFQSDRYKCTCGTDLSITWQARKGDSGTVSICYDNILGPQTATIYILKCSRKDGCKKKFMFSSTIDKDHKIQYTHPSHSEYFQANNCTIFHHNVFAELQKGLIEDGDSFESYTSRFNHRFKVKIHQMQEKSQHFGKTQHTRDIQCFIERCIFHVQTTIYHRERDW